MIAVTDGRRPAVGGARSGIETGYRESGVALRRRKYGCVVAVGASRRSAVTSVRTLNRQVRCVIRRRRRPGSCPRSP
eukprot:2797862-Pleurochrysis_carterae.AAC.1